MKTFYWLVKREFWEHRGGFFWAPVITGGVFLLLNLMGIIAGEVLGGHFDGTANFIGNNMRVLDNALDKEAVAKVGAGLDLMMYSTTMMISIVLGFVVFFYCLGSLYDDRRDRSLLFWKSLPISDTATVLSKVVSATVVAPFIALVSGVLTGIVMLLMFAIALSLHGVGVWHLLTLAHPFRVIVNLVGSIPLYFLWALPTVGWLMLCSAWARSKPFLWAVVIPVAMGIGIGWFNLLGTLHVSNGHWAGWLARILLSVFPGGWFNQIPNTIQHSDLAGSLAGLDLNRTYMVLTTPDIWIGVLAAAAMLAGAIWLRRWRDDS
ncbi:hypothetical protein ACPPVV_07685 [Rhodanobacter sp. Col0626]|uniref:hypothetical protein n=1 Tax=Rhodanobacter sp. Col0626 TaxID=3415679 RepID=UPI003CEDE2FD